MPIAQGTMMSPTSLAHITGFERDQRRRGLMPSTIERRRRALARFAWWLGPDTCILDASRDQIEEFLDGRDLGARGRYCWISNLSAFYGYAVREGLAAHDPTARIVRPRLRQTLPRPASLEQLRPALDAADPMMRAWLHLGALAGLRCQEIAGVQRDDVLDTAQPPMLRVTRAKGGHERMVPLNPELVAALRALPMPRSGPIFTRPDGRPFTPAQVSQFGNRHLRDHGAGCTMHQLRHLFATLVLADTGDIRLVQELLGHASVATAAIYAKVVQRKAVKVVGRLTLNPR